MTVENIDGIGGTPIPRQNSQVVSEGEVGKIFNWAEQEGLVRTRAFELYKDRLDTGTGGTDTGDYEKAAVQVREDIITALRQR